MESLEYFKIKDDCKIEMLPTKYITKYWGFCGVFKPFSTSHLLQVASFAVPVSQRNRIYFTWISSL